MISESAAPTARGVAEVGGKAASLFRLVDLGFDVPAFFVLTTAAQPAAGGRIDPGLLGELRGAWERLGGDARQYAVRSSGSAEDSADNSFAGVFETLLYVEGFDGVIAAIERCWESHRSGIAAAYRAARDVGDAANDNMAVIVQRMVQADWAGVCFTADPVSQALSVTVVNAVRGDADKLVSGLAAPEEIRVDATGRIIDRVSPGDLHLPQPLLDGIVTRSRALAEAIGFPQDIEWAADDGGLRFLQSRPITTVASVFNDRAIEPWAGGGDPDSETRVWSRAFADEVWTAPVSPLFYDVQNLTAHVTGRLRAAGDIAPLPPDIFKYHRAAAYIDADLVDRLYRSMPQAARRAGVLGLLPPEARATLRDAAWDWRGALHKFWTFEVRDRQRSSLAHNYRFLAASWAPFMATTDRLLDTDPAALDEPALVAHLAETWAAAANISYACGVAVVHHAHDLKLWLTALLERWCGGDGEEWFAAVSEALEGTKAEGESRAIAKIAAAVRAAGVSEAALASPAAFAAAAPGSSAVAAFDDFLKGHRHRGANYKDLIYPRWGDDPQALWQVVLAVDTAAPPRHGRADARRAAQRRALDLAGRGLGGLWRRPLLKALLRYNEIYAAVRDDHRYYFDRIWYLVRRVYAEHGRRAHRAGLLADPADIFYLNRPELAQLREGLLPPETAAARIVTRRADWMQTRIEQPAKFLRRGYVPDDAAVLLDDASTLRGIGVSPGRIEGVARIAYDIGDLARLERGDILVTRQTDPSWTPAFQRLGGLVLETGGVLAHGASLCREFGLPCVTAVEQAVKHIRDGSRIAIDGGSGRVELIS